MAIRRRQIQPDQLLTLRSTGEELEVVSDEAFLTALLDVGKMVCFAGGAMSAIVHRAPTDLDGEMVTVGAVLEWKDRTDAKPQPEPATGNGFIHSNVTVSAGRMAIPVPPLSEEELAIEADMEAVAQREGEKVLAGVGAASLPFQRDGEPLEDRIVHGDTPDPKEQPRGKSDEGINDGIKVDPDAEDDSDIPENMR